MLNDDRKIVAYYLEPQKDTYIYLASTRMPVHIPCFQSLPYTTRCKIIDEVNNNADIFVKDIYKKSIEYNQKI